MSWQTTDQRLRQLAAELDLDISHRKVETPEAAEEPPDTALVLGVMVALRQMRN